MDTIKIRHLELRQTELLVEKKYALQTKYYSQVRNIHLQIKKIERTIKHEQIKLWNYTLQSQINEKNYIFFYEIYKYFDELNYKSLLFEKFTHQISELEEQIELNEMKKDFSTNINLKSEKIYYLNFIKNKDYLKTI